MFEILVLLNIKIQFLNLILFIFDMLKGITIYKQ